MKISIFGTSNVGLVTGASLYEVGHHVICTDIDSAKSTFKEGDIPILEPDFDAMVKESTRFFSLHATTDQIILEGLRY